jgi:hypothetical protein
LPQTLGNYTVANILNASAVFQANNCSNTGTSSNAADCLAAQLLAAELNVANGAKPCGTIATANAFLVSIAYTGPGYVAPKNVTWRSQAVAYATTLNTYNNGGSC